MQADRADDPIIIEHVRVSAQVGVKLAPSGSAPIRSSWIPSLVPKSEDEQNVYLVVDDFGTAGRSSREADVESTDLETVIADMIAGQYSDQIRVIGFNAAEHWADDVSADVTREIRRRFNAAYDDIPCTVIAFVKRHAGHEKQLNRRLV